MLVDFEDLPETSRLWVYMADVPLSDTQVDKATSLLETFSGEWEAHQQPLKASFTILENQFILLAVDESVNVASGCSIDSSVHIMKLIQSELGVDLFDRSLVPFEMNGKVVTIRVSELKEKLHSGVWNANTVTFNILVDCVGAYRRSWKLPAGETWLQRFTKAFEKTHVS